MHRSGTSVIAGVVETLGVFMGSRKLGKSKANPLGHFEDLDFLYLNESILKSIGCSWDRPPTEELVLKLEGKFERIPKLIEKRNSKHEIWGWKDPRTSVLIDLYFPYLSNPYFIVCRRKNVAVAKSLKKRNGFSLERGIGLDSLYKIGINTFLSKTPSVKVKELRYKNIITNPEETVEEIIKFLEISPSKEQIRKASEMILSRAKVKELSETLK
jgi:hypothetical protein